MHKNIFRKALEWMRLGHQQRLSVPQPYPTTGSEDYSIESLWNDFERRTWHYDQLKPNMKQTNPRLLNWIGSVDHSGYTREQCLRWLISHAVPGDENRILLRLADWVPQVRSVAKKWTLNNVRKLPVASIQANQRLFLYLSRKERVRCESAWNEVEAVLLQRAESMTIGDFFQLEPMFRRFLFDLSLSGSQALRPLLLRDREPFNRLLLLSHSGCGTLRQEELLNLRRDKSVFVRRRYIYWRLEHNTRPTEDELVAFAKDKNRGLRELGRFYLNKFYNVDAYEIYMKADGNDLYFIADYAKVENVDLFVQGLQSSSSHVREICLRALTETDLARLRKLDIAPLILNSRRTRTIISRCLPQILNVPEILELREVFEQSSPSGAISFLATLEQVSFWVFIDVALDYLISDPTPAIVMFIRNAVSMKTQLFERLPENLRDSIERKVACLKETPNSYPPDDMILLEFMTRQT